MESGRRSAPRNMTAGWLSIDHGRPVADYRSDYGKPCVQASQTSRNHTIEIGFYAVNFSIAGRTRRLTATGSLRLKAGTRSINPDKSHPQLDEAQLKRMHAKVALVQPFDLCLFERAETVVNHCEMCDHQTHHDLLYRTSRTGSHRTLCHGLGYIENKDA